MIKDKIIIGFEGDKGAGKNTCASMFNYIFSVGIQKAKYSDWYHLAKIKNFTSPSIFHFADHLKDICAIITNLRRDLFDDHTYKDILWWIYGTDDFVSDEDIEKRTQLIAKGKNYKAYYKIMPLKATIAEHLMTANKLNIIPIIKLRSILEFVGTEMFRNMYDEHYWSNKTIQKVIQCSREKGYAFIADVRFKEEITSLRYAAHDASTGRLEDGNRIKVYFINVGETLTFTEKDETNVHNSDKRLKDFDYYIPNPRVSYLSLFNQCLKAYQYLFLN